MPLFEPGWKNDKTPPWPGEAGPSPIGGNDEYTEVLLHMDDSFLSDSSDNNLVFTKFNGAAMSSAQKKFGAGSLLLENTNDFIADGDIDGWHFGTGDFTVDLWIRPTSLPGVGVSWGLVTQYSVSINNRAWGMWLKNTAGTYQLQSFFCANTDGTGNQVFAKDISISIDTWYHLAFVRNGSDYFTFLNGVEQGTTENMTVNVVNSAADLHVGNRDTENSFQGYMDEVRVSKGIARWTENFTPPAVAYS